MRVLLIGGSGLISQGITTHLLARGDVELTHYNRGRRSTDAPPGVTQLIGDRNDPGFVAMFASKPFDVVIDMICFTPEHAQADLMAFSGKCDQFIFCSTVCTYGVEIPPGLLIDETFEQNPISQYEGDKLHCENLFRRADERGELNVTIIRPSSTYGEGNPLIDQLEVNSVAWDRIERDLPVLCAGDGLGLWNATHRDDVGKLFAYAAMNSKTFGKNYNATIDRAFTWRDYYREAAAAMGKWASLIFMPAEWIIRHDPKRFGLLRDITQFHGAYDSSAARRDVPEFRCEVSFQDGAKRTLADLKRRGAWKSSANDALYEQMIDKAQQAGVVAVDA